MIFFCQRGVNSTTTFEIRFNKGKLVTWGISTKEDIVKKGVVISGNY